MRKQYHRVRRGREGLDVRGGRPSARLVAPTAIAAAAMMLSVAGCSASSSDSSATTSSSTSSTVGGGPVPSKYRPLYEGVSAQLDAFGRTLGRMPAVGGTASRRPVAGAELLTANGNRLSALLGPSTMPSVELSLDRLKALGVGGVTIGIKVPMLLPSFSPDAGAYADFYAAVARQVRARGMTVSVELGALFCGTVYAQCSNPFGGSFDTFVSDTVAQARIVLSRVRPTYLTLFAEPDTEAKLTGDAELDTPTGAARAASDIVAAIGPHPATEIGAGAGTWLPPSFASAIAAEPVDYLDTHIYPVGTQEGANAAAAARIAEQAHKPLVVDEVWLYKSDQPGLGTSAGGAEQVFRQDVFSFWEPLDARFLQDISTWADKANVAYVSAFWSWRFFAYLTWTPPLDAAPFAQLDAAFNRVLVPALEGGSVTAVGKRWGGHA